MTLRANPDQKGVWLADPPITAGAHALIVGISEYPHLSGGSGPLAARNGGLGQLEVCAKSAARLFAWLLEAREVGGAPLASCRLLLAPAAGEKDEVEKLTGGHYAKPDFRPLRDACEDWGAAVNAGGATADTNVALLFYSGHGVEISVNPAIVARDFLDPNAPAAGAGNALALDPTARAIKSYGVNRALFLIDACRDASELVQELDVTGESPLKPARIVRRRPEGVIILHSTASSLKSYQLATDPATLFSQAVIDALEGPPPDYVPYDTKSSPWLLLFSALEGHVKRRVAELLAERSALAHQAVEADGLPYNSSLLVARRQEPDWSEGPPTRLAVDATDPAAALSRAIDKSARQVLASARSLTSDDVAAARNTGPAGVPDFHNYNVMHQVLGHESITGPWLHSLRLLDAGTGEAVPGDVLQLVGSHVQETDERLSAWLDAAVSPGEGQALWIGAEGRGDGPSFAIVVPREIESPIPVRLDLTFQKEGYDWSLVDMSARLGDPKAFTNLGAADYAWWTLWEAQRTEMFGDLGAAARTIERAGDFEEIVMHKRQTPVAAALATAYLLRAEAVDRLHDWPRNIANWFEWLPDGPILWAETLLRSHEQRTSGPSAADLPSWDEDECDLLAEILESPEYREARDYFGKVADRGAPQLAASLRFAARQAAIWRRALDSDLVDEPSERLAAACDIVERAARHCLSGSSFGRFAGRGIATAPMEVLGLQRLVAPAVVV